MSDKYKSYSPHLESPAENAAAITPNDTTDLTNATRSLYIGGAGNVKIDTVLGDTVTLSGVVAGTVIPVRVSRVYATGTTATNLVGLW